MTCLLDFCRKWNAFHIRQASHHEMSNYLQPIDKGSLAPRQVAVNRLQVNLLKFLHAVTCAKPQPHCVSNWSC